MGGLDLQAFESRRKVSGAAPSMKSSSPCSLLMVPLFSVLETKSCGHPIREVP